MAESFGWLYGQHLEDRWDMNDAEIADLIVNQGLPAYDGETMLPINVEEEKEYMMSPDPYGWKIAPTLKDRINILLFRLSEVEKFEKEHPELIRRATTIENKKGRSLECRDVATAKKEKTLRPSQRHKLKAQEMAKTIWENDKTRTITAIAKDFEHSSKTLFEREYNFKTIYRWIAPICPNRSPGRRPKIT